MLSTPTPLPAGAAPAAEPDERGQTTIADRVIERIAMQAVTEVEMAGGSAPTMLGMAIGAAGLDRAARVTATIAGRTAALAVQLSVAYPASVSQTAREARAQLIQRVQGLTGHTVTRVDITVTALHSNLPPVRRVR